MSTMIQGRLRLHRVTDHDYHISKRRYRGFVLAPGKWRVDRFPDAYGRATDRVRERIWRGVGYGSHNEGLHSRLKDLLDAIDTFLDGEPDFTRMIEEDEPE